MFSSSGDYFCPESEECSTLVAYRHYVETLPLTQTAQVFGLSENSDVAYKVLPPAGFLF